MNDETQPIDIDAGAGEIPAELLQQAAQLEEKEGEGDG